MYRIEHTDGKPGSISIVHRQVNANSEAAVCKDGSTHLNLNYSYQSHSTTFRMGPRPVQALDYFPHGATASAMPMATTTRPVTAVKAPITCRVLVLLFGTEKMMLMSRTRRRRRRKRRRKRRRRRMGKLEILVIALTMEMTRRQC